MDDILLTDQFELVIVNGMLVRGESTRQHQHLLLATNKGDWRFSPLTGVGVASFLKDEGNTGGLLPEIKAQFELDGMQVTSLKIVDGKIVVDAKYKNE
jgi:hypothetical protein